MQDQAVATLDRPAAGDDQRQPRTATLNKTADLDRFLARVERRAFRMAEIATGNREDALDIVQEAMYRLARRYGGRGENEWGPLFQRILQSALRDWYRRARIRNRLRVWFGLGNGEDAAEDDGLDTLEDTRARTPEHYLKTERALATLEQALRALPLRQQQVFLLRAWEGLDVATAARAMGCTEGSVKTHYSRALTKLRDILGEHWP